MLAQIVLLKTTLQGGQYEERKILPSKEGGAGGVLARTIGRALPNKHPPMVAGWRGLLCRHFGGVWIMSEREHTDCAYCEAGIAEEHKAERRVKL